ncbi:MAG: alkaline phosphatase family protein [Candidatus Krumholzibacteriaceae bacterium]
MELEEDSPRPAGCVARRRPRPEGGRAQERHLRHQTLRTRSGASRGDRVRRKKKRDMAARSAYWAFPVLLVLASSSLAPRPAAARGPEGEGSLLAARTCAAQPGDTVRYVIHVSVDGLRADAVRRLGPGGAPHFWRLRIEGAFTDNARTDYDYTVTLPDHTCQLTGRAVLGPEGHGVTFNTDDPRTLAQVHGSYVAGVFDVAHDNGLATGLYASKSKFAIFDRSWNEVNGAPDVTGPDNGRNKIDVYVNDGNTAALTDSFIANMKAAPNRYSLIHLADPDGAGHTYGWESAEYFVAIRKDDRLLGRILDLVDGDPRLSNRTYLVVTADHGGAGTEHSDATKPADYTIPFYVWGPGVPAGGNLYRLNPSTRLDPGSGRPTYSSTPQPIRNGEAANMSLDLLGLPRVAGSTIDAAQDYRAVVPGGAAALPSVTITRPRAGAKLACPVDVEIDATADPRRGAIARVEFYENYVYLGADSTSPYTYVWKSAGGDRCHVTARAVRTDGLASTASVDF